ncbi:MAG: response regulator [Bryobacteraceae bacterium]|nr:response regulator [Bryobacteraceae bacterium]MDW8379644.1 response regulator [Bryobacterales bacterium]
MTKHGLRVLLIDGHAGDSGWIQELVADFEESRFGGGWMHGVEIVPVERLSDAITVLEDATDGQNFDVVLLNPTLADSNGLHSYLRLRQRAPSLPVVILADEDDPDLAVSLVREGAQDFLPKTTLESASLAHALRLAVERWRLFTDVQALTWVDEATGLLNWRGFHLVAGHDLMLAQKLEKWFALVLIEVGGLQTVGQLYGAEEEQLALADVADLLRTVAKEPVVRARMGQSSFVLSFVTGQQCESAILLGALRRGLQRWFGIKANRQLTLRVATAWRQPGEELTLADLLAQAEVNLEPLLHAVRNGPTHGSPNSAVSIKPSSLGALQTPKGQPVMSEPEGQLCDNKREAKRHAHVATAFP